MCTARWRARRSTSFSSRGVETVRFATTRIRVRCDVSTWCLRGVAGGRGSEQAALVGRLTHPRRIGVVTAPRRVARRVVVAVDAVALGPVTQAPADGAGAVAPSLNRPEPAKLKTKAPAAITATMRITVSTADIRTSAQTLRVVLAALDSTPNRQPLPGILAGRLLRRLLVWMRGGCLSDHPLRPNPSVCLAEQGHHRY